MSHLSEQDLTPATKKPDSIEKREKYIAEVEQQMTDIQTIYIAMKDHLDRYKSWQKRADQYKDDPGHYIMKNEAIVTWANHLELTRLFFTKISDLALDTNDLQMNGHPFGF